MSQVKPAFIIAFIAAATVFAALFLSSSTFGEQFGGNPALKRSEFRFITDVRYAEGAGKYHLMDVLAPGAKLDKPVPVLVFIHGGAWRAGDKARSRKMLQPVVKAGYVGVTVNYRLSGTAKFPAQIEDCKAAVRFVRKHAPEWGGDPDRIGVYGTSAGGHLAALLGVSNGAAELEGSLGETDASSDVQAVCDWFGPADLTTFHGEAPRSVEMVSQLLGGDPKDKPDAARLASPVTYVDKSDPPFLIIHGDNDPTVPVGQSRALYEKLAAAKVDAELVIVPGGGHGDFRGCTPDFDGLMEKMIEFFDTRLK